ncbi:MAG: hypothetical protein CVT47_01105 [Thermoplasmata archaeon HGW-Thermoplasmata-2]|nr:MAG: hypothetical protein CVT47_01105 [Thermoplasmata archaeon HGW-Thermoplasmata-2]
MDLAELGAFNPWWKSGKVKDEWLKDYKRKIYREIAKCVEKRQIVLLKGLRRTGKTTLLFQIIQNLLDSGARPSAILYFSFDERAYDVKEVLADYQKFILGGTFENSGKVFLFLDEIQKVGDWENKIKTIYDLYPSVKIFVSGSSSLRLGRGAKESLAGRAIEFMVAPLEFDEFLELNGYDVGKIRKNPNLWKGEMLPLFYRYMKFGTFPELANEKDESFARRYILDSVIERIIYRDIPEEFGASDIELLRAIVYIVGKKPGAIINFSEMSRNLGRDERTISNYFEYLENALIIRFVFNYRGSPVATMRKMKKAYFTSANMIFALNPAFDPLMPSAIENVVAAGANAKFFYRNGYEVDFINDSEGTAIEVKTEGKKLKQLKKLMSDFPAIAKSIIVDFELEGEEGGIKIVPAWKFLLFGWQI